MAKKNAVTKFQNALKATRTFKAKGAVSPKVIKAFSLSRLTQESDVKARLGNTDSKDSISLCLTNDGNFEAMVDISGTVLAPDSDSYQRLLVITEEEKPVTFVMIPAGESRELSLSTCCMDLGKQVPRRSVLYVPRTDLAPERDLITVAQHVAAKRAVAKLPDEARPRVCDVQTDSFCIQRQVVTSKKSRLPSIPRLDPKSPVTKDMAKHDYVQQVSWDQRKPYKMEDLVLEKKKK